MARFSQTTVITTLASNVANAGTLTLAYPAGTNQAAFTGNNASANSQVVLNDNDVFSESAAKIGVTFGASDITVTNSSGVTWPAGALARIGLARGATDDIAGIQGAPITALSMSVGTANDTVPDVGAAFNQTTLNNIVRTLGTKINALSAAVKAAGVIR